MEKLAAFDPVLVGTVPIGVDTDESDLDIICCSPDQKSFPDCLVESFSGTKGFTITEKIINQHLTILAGFTLDSFPVEIFGQRRPTKEQEAFRHIVVEHAILESRGEEFRAEVIRLKKAGLKTEPAFAHVLGIAGDPYQVLLEYQP